MLAEVPPEDKNESRWKIQFFRSIPIDSALFDETKINCLQSKVNNSNIKSLIINLNFAKQYTNYWLDIRRICEMSTQSLV